MDTEETKLRKIFKVPAALLIISLILLLISVSTTTTFLSFRLTSGLFGIFAGMNIFLFGYVIVSFRNAGFSLLSLLAVGLLPWYVFRKRIEEESTHKLSSFVRKLYGYFFMVLGIGLIITVALQWSFIG